MLKGWAAGRARVPGCVESSRLRRIARVDGGAIRVFRLASQLPLRCEAPAGYNTTEAPAGYNTTESAITAHATHTTIETPAGHTTLTAIESAITGLTAIEAAGGLTTNNQPCW